MVDSYGFPAGSLDQQISTEIEKDSKLLFQSKVSLQLGIPIWRLSISNLA